MPEIDDAVSTGESLPKQEHQQQHLMAGRVVGPFDVVVVAGLQIQRLLANL